MAARITPSVETTANVAVRFEHADERQKLADESVESGQPHAGQAREDHRGRNQRQLRGDAPQVGNFPRVIAFVDHADQEEEGPGRESVIDDLQKAASDSLRR